MALVYINEMAALIPVNEILSILINVGPICLPYASLTFSPFSERSKLSIYLLD